MPAKILVEMKVRWKNAEVHHDEELHCSVWTKLVVEPRHASTASLRARRLSCGMVPACCALGHTLGLAQ